MKRFLASALVLSSFSLFAFVGCEDKAEVKKTDTVSTPDGKTTTTDTHKIESTGGDKAPANTAGETAKSPEAPK